MSEDDNKPSLLQLIKSILSAGFGVQSQKNRERDFKHGNHRAFIIAGIIATLLFIVGLYGVVQLILNSQ